MVGGLGILTWVVLVMLGINVTVCPVKRMTGVPCPGCGTSRTLKALLHGDFVTAFTLNPINLFFCLVVAAVLLTTLVSSYRQKEDTLSTDIKRIESVIQRPVVYIPLIAVVLINWISVIIKGL